MGALNRSMIPLVRYRLARAALDLRSFTVAELVTLTGVPVGTVYYFLSKLKLTKESLPAATPGRPREIYTLTNQAFEKLLDENFEIARTLQEAGIVSPIHENAPAALEARSRAAVEVEMREQESHVSQCGMSYDNLQKLYVDELKDLYSAEKQILQALPRMAKKASNELLKKAFETHLEETRSQIGRLDRIFELLGKSARGKKCKGMEGLIEEGKEMMQEDMDPQVMDAVLIASAQKVEHYEIAGYGTVRMYAQLLGENQHVRLLQQTLDEEGNTDKKLTQLAESSINTEIKAEAHA